MKKGQVTFFIILAIFIVFVIIMIFSMLRSNPAQEKTAKTYNLEQNKNNIVSDYQLIIINNTSVLEGYVYDQDNPTRIMSLLFYIDSLNESNYAGKTDANISGTCGILQCNNRFTWEIPQSIKDSNTHTINIYANNGSNIKSMILLRNDITYTCITECKGKECGPDMCNGVCGNCPYAYMCNSIGKCVLSCKSKTCQELGKTCGTFDDGCGNLIDCGKCKNEDLCYWCSHTMIGVLFKDCWCKCGYEKLKKYWPGGC
jgi:hypothetical protein